MKRNIVIATVAAAALIGGGTATALAVTDDGTASARPSEERTDGGARAGTTADRDDDRDDGRDDADDDRDGRDGTDDDTAASAAPGGVTAAEAIEAALRDTSGTAVSADLDDDGGRTAWDVDVLGGDGTWHSVRIDPDSAKVLDSRKETGEDDDTAEVRAALKGSSTTAAEAARAAAAKGTVTSVDLDDDGTPAWEAETRAKDGTERDWRVALDGDRVTQERADRDDAADDGDDD
ncbi:PepSY domain-containing protein [Streptomyces minutiscleroticus]|uniref:PepSY domain-containing protein n=1 Tax=Streptomyces minutiscleroticus TaxID=68238 RepID=UPI00332ABE63